MIEMRLRSRISDAELQEKVGKILTDDDYNVLLTRAARILKPDGKPLAVYLPGALPEPLLESSYATLHGLKSLQTDNRGLASGTERVQSTPGSRTRTKLVSSSILGAFDPKPPFTYCRLTAWSGRETEKFSGLWPLFTAIGGQFQRHVPDRYAAQMEFVANTNDDWVIPGTPFTTITVNNTYPTGVHTDAGDLDEGFSTLACLRYGAYRGGNLVFPEYRVAVNMGHGDVLLMDAHEWHGNTGLEDLTPECGWCDEKATRWFIAPRPDTGKVVKKEVCDEHWRTLITQGNIHPTSSASIRPMERISVVSYYRTKMAQCGTMDEEAAKAAARAEKRSGTMVDEMAAEATMVRTAGA